MKKAQSLPTGIINPFSPSFLDTWQLWKDFREGYDKFKYKGVFSEQLALKKLSELAGFDELLAIEIVEQSISRQWTGFYELKNKKNGQPNSDKQRQERIADVQAELKSRIAARGQSASATHLKAV